MFSFNESPEAVALLEDHLENTEWKVDFGPSMTARSVHWQNFSRNPTAGHILVQPRILAQMDTDYWHKLCTNPAQEVVDLLLDEYARYPDSPKFNWAYVARNPHPAMVDIMAENLWRIVPENMFHSSIWWLISANPGAMSIIEQNPDNVDYRGLCNNSSAGQLIQAALQDPTKAQQLRFDFLATNPVIFQSPLAFAGYQNPMSID